MPAANMHCLVVKIWKQPETRRFWTVDTILTDFPSYYILNNMYLSDAMNTNLAQRLLHKIQSLLDDGQGQGISRLEKDLLKSYIQQLYDLVVNDEPAEESTSRTSASVQAKETLIPPPPPPVIERIPPPVMEHIPPPVELPEEKPIPGYVEEELAAPVSNPMAWKPVDPVPHVQETIPTPPVVEAPVMREVPVPPPVVTPVAEPVADEALNSLFEVLKKDEISGKVSHVPIASIESALGLNERIFTLNDLFGGDRALFEETCTQLNQLSSFAEAKALLMSGVAQKFGWTHPERVKMAEQFIRIMARKYPKA